MKKKLSVVVILSVLLIIPAFSVPAKGGNEFFGMAVWLLTGGLDCNEQPKAVFSVSEREGKEPLSVDFDASHSEDPNGQIETYEWDFGDGSTGYGEKVSHTFYDPGTYTVELTVEDNDRNEDSYTRNIEVKSSEQGPVASFDASPKSGEAPLRVSLDASSSRDPDGSIKEYAWNFGDGGGVTGKKVSHTYEDAGDYTVELQVKDNDGNTDTTSKKISVSTEPSEDPVARLNASPTQGEVPLKVNFDASGSYDPDGSIVSYSWSYGNGDVDSGRTTSYTFNSAGTYTVELQVKDNDNNTDTSKVQVTVEEPANESPEAQFNASPTSGEAPLQVSFDASGSYDSDGSIVSYNWDFGNGATSSGRTTNYTYNNSGTYDATLTVTDNDGDTDTTSTQIDVDSAPPKNKDVILSLAQGRDVHYGEWFDLRINGYGNEGTMDILFNARKIEDIDINALGSWNYSRTGNDSDGRITITFWGGSDDFQTRSIVEIRMRGDGETDLELTNAKVEYNDYKMDLSLIGNTIK